MFHSRTMNNRINTLHEKALTLVDTNKPNITFHVPLKEDKSVKIHQKNLQVFTAEIYKVKNDLGPEIMADLFHFVGKPYNVRNNLIIKGKQTAQFILEQKVYILLLQNYGN